MRTIREAGTWQAIGRLRLVGAKTKKDVYLISKQAVGVPIDRVVTFKPSKADMIFVELGGLYPSQSYRSVSLGRARSLSGFGFCGELEKAHSGHRAISLL